jgi:hypothetical protein
MEEVTIKSIQTNWVPDTTDGQMSMSGVRHLFCDKKV